MEMLVQGGQRQSTARVYCYSEPHFRLEDGTSLYLEWLIEGNDCALYVVPAEPGGWRQRRRYEGSRSSIQPVPQAEAQIIVSLVCSELEHEGTVPVQVSKQKISADDKALTAAVSITACIPNGGIAGMHALMDEIPAGAGSWRVVEAAS